MPRPALDQTGDQIASVATLVARAERIVVCSGAGISTDSGIPDYRGPAGLWTKDPSAARLVDLASYLSDPQLRAASWQRRTTHPALVAEPNAAHRALAQLYRTERLLAVLTQNVDGLHQRAGLPAEAVLELHGNIREAECVACRRRRPMVEMLARVRAGEPDPRCGCGGIVKSATVFFGQAVDAELFARAGRMLAAADLILAVGTSLRVAPISAMVGRAAETRPLVIVNAEPTRYDRLARAVVREPIGTAVPRLLAA